MGPAALSSKAGWLAAAGATLLLLTAPVSAALVYQLKDAALAARIDKEPVQAFSVDALWRMARRQDDKAARSATLENIVVNRLLADAARKSWGEAALFGGQGVGYTRDVALDDQLAATLRTLYGKELEAALLRLPGASLLGLIVEQAEPERAALDAVFGKPDQLKLAYTLNAEQQARARAIVVLRYRLPGGALSSMSLYDVYRRQNVQGRVALFNRQPDFIQQQARQQLGGLFTLSWSRQQFGERAVADLRRALSDQDDVVALQQLHGIGADMHGSSVLLQKLATQVSQGDITSYYQQHRDEFQRIEKVKARHIRVADEALAQKIHNELRGGSDFSALARRHSIASDAANGGELDWIRHEGKPDWLAQLAFSQPEGQLSRPIRSPVGPQDKAHWEIVQVEQRVQGYQAADSEAVRYAASQAIARATAVAQLAELRARLLRGARIDINRSLLDQPLRSLGGDA
ncbi:peptidylprolyl isomerase [Oxalobacteraceae bacterium]|nr:peptidylprolyl isomerase [Oxalobacteraceae bacterium]